MSIFHCHGSIEVRFEGNLLITRATGPANEELIKRYVSLTKPILDKYGHSAHACILELRGEALITPSAKHRLKEFLRSYYCRNRVVTACVYSENIDKNVIERFWLELFDGSHQKVAFFDCLTEAKDWAIERVRVANKLSGSNSLFAD